MTKPLCVFIACLTVAVSFGQDPIFSQYYALPNQLNPGFSGSSGAPRAGAAYRHQWPGFQVAYRTYAFFYEQALRGQNSGIGVVLEADNAGDGIYRTTRLHAQYAYGLRITDNLAVRLGVEAGAYQTSIDWDRLVFPDQLDPLGGPVLTTGEQRPESTSLARLDLGAGLLLLSERMWLGASAKHLNTPNDAYLAFGDNLSRGLPLRYTAHGGFQIIVKGGNKHLPPSFVSPNFLFVSQGPYQQVNVGAYAAANVVFGGLWYRHTFGNPDAAIALVGFRKGILKIGFSYDLTVSKLAGRSGGTYELSFGIALNEDQRKKRSDQLNDCLRMFQ